MCTISEYYLDSGLEILLAGPGHFILCINEVLRCAILTKDRSCAFAQRNPVVMNTNLLKSSPLSSFSRPYSSSQLLLSVLD